MMNPRQVLWTLLVFLTGLICMGRLTFGPTVAHSMDRPMSPAITVVHLAS